MFRNACTDRDHTPAYAAKNMCVLVEKKTINLFSCIKFKKTNSGKKPHARTYDMHKEDVENHVLKCIKN